MMKFNIQLFASDTEVGFKVTNKVTGEKKLEKYVEQLSKVHSLLESIDKGKITAIENSSNILKEQTKNIEKQDNGIKDIKKNVSMAFNYSAIMTFSRALGSLTRTMSGYISKSAGYLENMNLLDVAYNNNTTSAEKFVNTLSEMYGLDESWGYRTVGIFKQLANAMGLANEVGDKLAKTMTQFSIDIASLYNMEPDSAVSILQSAISGQTKPARRLGADITQTTLQTSLQQAGIDRKIGDLSFTEKRLVIIGSLLNQVVEAQNDWGRTIESVANQTRILSAQWDRFTRALGNVFLPILKTILPYLNGILMVATELVNMFARLIGYKEEDFGISSSKDQMEDFGASLESANASAKKLKQGLRGFDQLNVITTPSDTSGGLGASLGVDKGILDYFNKSVDEYNKKLTDVKMKASDIRDSIMQWLGFTKLTNEATKKVSFKFDHITGGTVLGALAIGGGIFKGVTTIYGLFKKIGLFKFTELKSLIGLFSKGGATKNLTSLSSTLTAINPKIALIIAGVIALGGALVYAYKTNDEFKEKVNNMAKSVSKSFDDLKKSTKKLYDTTKPIWDLLGEAIKNNFSTTYETILAIFKTLTDEISGYANIFSDIINGDFGKAFDDWKEMIIKIQKNWFTMCDNIGEKFVNFTSKAIQKEVEFEKKISELPSEFGKWIGEAIGELTKKINETSWSELGETIVKKLTTINWDNFGSMFMGKTYNAFKKAIDDNDWANVTKIIMEKLFPALKTINAGKDFAKSFIDGFKQGITGKTTNLQVNWKPTQVSTVGTNKSTNPNDTSNYLVSGGASWKAYADGGLPKVGQLMVVNERGAELVGNLGGQSFVANQNQVVDLMDKKLSNVSTSLKPTFIIQVGSKEVAREVLGELNDMALSNGRPIVIGG